MPKPYVKALLVTGMMMIPLVSAGEAFAAGGGYGPTTPTGPSGAPGGYSAVVAAKNIPPTGGSLTASVDNTVLTVRVPNGDFPSTFQVVVTTSSLGAVQSALPKLGYAGYHAVVTIGIKIYDTNGKPINGAFSKPVTLTVSGRLLGISGEKVLEFTGPASAVSVPATLSPSTVTFSFSSDPDFAIVNGPAAARAVVGATSTSTGKPFRAETLVGLVLLMTGAIILLYRARERALTDNING